MWCEAVTKTMLANGIWGGTGGKRGAGEMTERVKDTWLLGYAKRRMHARIILLLNKIRRDRLSWTGGVLYAVGYGEVEDIPG